jgi:hypothetical protein
MNVAYSWSFQIYSGNNTLLLPQAVLVNKGNFIILTQISGQVAIDSTGNASYSDLVWISQTQWTKLNPNSNWRFYFATINNFTSYFNTFKISHTYSNIGLYNLSFVFLSSNQIFSQIINITDCKY